MKEHRLVTYYGHPNSTNMGILGEMEPGALMEKLKEQAQAYSNADPSHPAGSHSSRGELSVTDLRT